jgi:integrase
MKKKRKQFSLYQRGGVWYVRLWDEDTGTYTSAKSTGETDRDAAAVRAAAMKRDNEIKPREDDPLFTDALLKFWKEKKNLTPRYKHATISNIENHVVTYSGFKKIRLSQIKHTDINNFADHLEMNGRPASVINRILLSLKTFCLHAYSRGKMPRNIADGKQVEKKKEIKKKRGELRPPEIMKLAAIEWPDHRMKVAVMLGCFAGMRRGEIRALRWKDIDFKTNYIYVRRNYTDVKDLNGNPVFFPPKADSTREFPYMIFPELRAAVLKQWDDTPFKKPDDLVLPNVWFSNQKNSTAANSHSPLPDTAFKREFSLMLEKIGISKKEQEERFLSFHSTRHSFTSFIDMSGSNKTGMSLTGHSTREVFENYSHANTEAVISHLTAANEFLNKFRRRA